MKNKSLQIKKQILNLLESGKFKEGDKLPSTRSIASKLGVSLIKVQQEIDQLAEFGILDIKPKRGTFLQQNWRERLLPINFCAFQNPSQHPWLKKIEEVFEKELPQIRYSYQFKKGVFELRTTLTVQSNRDYYMDLSEIFEELYPDKSIFFVHPFKNFYTGDKLIGIPFIFSPRLIFHNIHLIRKAGCKAPHPGWKWEDFIDCIKKLKKVLPKEKIFNWHEGMYLWINFVFRAGGKLFDFTDSDPVKIDHPNTQYGLQLFTELKHELGIKNINYKYEQDFLNGNAAFMLAPREILPQIIKSELKTWDTVPLPLINGGKDVNAQATDLICIRKECTDYELAKKFIKLMLSEEVQDIVGTEKYGIPIRKSSAFKSIDFNDPRDTLFLHEASKITAEYNINSPELSRLISEGIRQIWTENRDIKETTRNLANAIRTLLQIERRELTPKIE